jgi:hypothetical protein
MTQLAENTATNLGTNVPVNVTRRITWDASQAATNFASFKFRILANDGRGLLNLHFITVPAMGAQPALTLSSQGVEDPDLLFVWFWLVATGDPSISFANGTVTGVGGAYDQQVLASGSSTTAQGRAFIFQRLNVRAATADEITEAQGGNYGFVNLDGNNVVKLP